MTRILTHSSLLHTAFACAMLALAASARGQASAPSTNYPSNSDYPVPIVNKQTTGATQGAATAAGTALQPRPLPGVRGGLITEVGSGRAVGEGSRVLTVPGKCTPKAHSLDCVSETAQSSGGADVSGRVRKGVIGEVGAGKATTEGAGKAQGSKTCTPAPGKLTCD
jgi:hypothetical protein